jgi:hypothetical protein
MNAKLPLSPVPKCRQAPDLRRLQYGDTWTAPRAALLPGALTCGDCTPATPRHPPSCTTAM